MEIKVDGCVFNENSIVYSCSPRSLASFVLHVPSALDALNNALLISLHARSAQLVHRALYTASTLNDCEIKPFIIPSSCVVLQNTLINYISFKEFDWDLSLELKVLKRESKGYNHIIILGKSSASFTFKPFPFGLRPRSRPLSTASFTVPALATPKKF